MKQLLFAILSLFFIVVACSKSKPRGILSEKKMTSLMTEVYVVDGYLNTLSIDSSRKMLPILYENLFSRFKIDSATFMKNLDYYYGNPIELEKLNTNVQKELAGYERKAQQIDSIRQAHVRDSLNTAHRWQRLAQEMQDLILHVYIDSSAYRFAENNSNFFVPVPIHIDRHELRDPALFKPTPPIEEANEVEVPADSLGTAPLTELSADSVIQEPVELMPVIDTTSNLPHPFRYQRFEWNRSKQNLQ